MEFKDNLLINLTENEKKVLLSLVENSKITDTKIAENLRISSQAVKNIRKKLEKNNIILKYTLDICYKTLGINSLSLMLLKCTSHGWNIIKKLGGEKEIIKHIPNIVAMFKVYDTEITHIVFCGFNSSEEQNNYLDAVQTKLDGFIEIREVYSFPPENILKESEDRLISNVVKEIGREKIFKPWSIEEIIKVDNKKIIKREAVDLNENEKYVLKSLISNSRAGDATIARKIGITTKGVSKIRKKLEENIIAKYKTKFNYEKLGINIFALSFTEITPKAYHVLKKQGILKSFKYPNILKVFYLLGQKYIILFGFRDIFEVDKYFHYIQTNMSDYFKVRRIFIFSNKGMIKNSSENLFFQFLDKIKVNKIKASKLELSLCLTLLKSIE